MIYGSTTPGTVHFAVAANTVVVGESFAVDRPQFLRRIAAYLDGDGLPDASQIMRGALYTEAGGLVAVGERRTIADGQDPGWVWFGFDGALHRVLPAGRYRPVVHTGPVSEAARFYTASLPTTASLIVAPEDPGALPAYVPEGAPDGPYWWFRVDEDGEVLGIFVNDDSGGGDGAESTAALFVQDDEPDHPGPYVWVHADEDGDPLVTVLADGDGPTVGDAGLFIGGDRPAATYPSVWLRPDDTGELVLMDLIGEPGANYPFAAGPPLFLPIDEADAIAPMLLETSDLIRLPADVDDEYLADLPFGLAQRVFALGGVIRGSRVSATAGWYGRSFDPTNGAHAIVRTDGPLAELVGERILVTRRTGRLRRSVAVYVHDEREFPDELDVEQLLLSRRAFLALGNHALDNIDTTVEILS